MGTLLTHSWYGPDIWYHLTWGRELIEQGRLVPQQRTLLTQPVFANVYALFQAVIYLLYAFSGLVGVSALFAALWFVIAGLWLHLARACRFPIAGPWLFLAFVVIAQTRFEQRPEIFSYLFLMATLAWYGREARGRDYALLFVLQVLWTNTHGYFALGPLIAAAACLAALVERRAPPWRALGVTTLGTFATLPPLGGWLAVWHNGRVGAGLRDVNAELMPPTLWPPLAPNVVFWCLALLVVWLIARALWVRRDVFAALLALGGLALALGAVRNLPLLPLLSAPLLATLPAEPLLGRARLMSMVGAAVAATLLAFAALTGRYQAAVGGLGSFGVHLEWSSYPIGAVEFLKNFRGKIFTDSYDGGYVEYHLPEARVAGDSYFSSPEITREFFDAIREPAALRGLHLRFDFDALLINVENLAVLDQALRDPEWALVYSDTHRALFRKRAQAAAVPLAAGTYFHGESLANWNDAFGPLSWTAVARKYRDRDLLAKILRDVSASPVIPAALYRMALDFGVKEGDRELVRSTLALREKVRDVANEPEIAALEARAAECCR